MPKIKKQSDGATPFTEFEAETVNPVSNNTDSTPELFTADITIPDTELDLMFLKQERTQLIEQLLATIPVAITTNTDFIKPLLDAAKQQMNSDEFKQANPDFEMNETFFTKIEQKSNDPLTALKDILEKMSDPHFNAAKKQALSIALPLSFGNLSVAELLLDHLKTDPSIKQPTRPINPTSLLETTNDPYFDAAKKRAIALAMPIALSMNNPSAIQFLWGSLTGDALFESKKDCLKIALQDDSPPDNTAVLSFILEEMDEKKYTVVKKDSLHDIIPNAINGLIPSSKVGILLEAVQKSVASEVLNQLNTTALNNPNNENIKQLLKLPTFQRLQAKASKLKSMIATLEKPVNEALQDLLKAVQQNPKALPKTATISNILNSATPETNWNITRGLLEQLQACVPKKRPKMHKFFTTELENQKYAPEKPPYTDPDKFHENRMLEKSREQTPSPPPNMKEHTAVSPKTKIIQNASLLSDTTLSNTSIRTEQTSSTTPNNSTNTFSFGNTSADTQKSSLSPFPPPVKFDTKTPLPGIGSQSPRPQTAQIAHPTNTTKLAPLHGSKFAPTPTPQDALLRSPSPTRRDTLAPIENAPRIRIK